MRLSLIVFVVGASLALNGCDTLRNVFRSSSKDNLDSPAELTAFTPSVAVHRLWQRSLGEGAPNSGLKQMPAILGGRIFAADASGALVALDAGSGNEIWQVDTGLRLGSGVAAAEGLVVVGTLDGKLLAFDADDGKSRWTAALSSEALAAPVIAEGLVIARTVDGRAYGFDADDGSRKWVFDRSVPLLTLRGNSAPLVVGERALLGYDNGKLVALDVDEGTADWEQTLASGEGRSEIDRTVDIDGEIASDGTRAYVVAFGNGVMAVDVESGRILWSRDLKAYGGVALAGEQLFVADADGVVWALNSGDGRVLWKKDGLDHRGLSSPAVIGDYVVVADLEGYVHWLKASDGAFAARDRVGKERVRATPLVVGNVAYIVGTEGDIAAYRVGG